MMNHKFWLDEAKKEAENSPDPSRKTGCVIVRGLLAIRGHNNFPTGVAGTPERLERPKKYTFMEHAERNAIYLAARRGWQLLGATIYLSWFPCADCARAIVQSGIKKLVGYEPDWSEERYGFREAETILREGEVEIEFVPRAA